MIAAENEYTALHAKIDPLTDEQLAAQMADESLDFAFRLEVAAELNRRLSAARDARHAAFHGHALRYGRVERRPGFKGHTTCLDCYYNPRHQWDGR